MSEKNAPAGFPLTIYLSADATKRLMAAADSQKRPAAEVAAEMLERTLPRLQDSGAPKNKIPYT